MSNPLTEPLIQLLMWLNEFAAQLPLPEAVSSWSVAIIFVAVLIKLLTYPLTVTQMRSMRGMQEIQPRMKELQKRFGDDREKLAQAQMELYREHGVNPFGGCMPLIIQMVVLFGLYRAIINLASQGLLDGERFLWIPNLAQCEPNPLCTDSSGGIGIPILLILLVVSQFAYQKYATPPSADPQAQAMNQTMKFMPLFFAFIFAKLAAGLVLYYTVFNVVSVAQQAWAVRGPSLSGILGLASGEAGSGTGEESAAAATASGTGTGTGTGTTSTEEDKQRQQEEEQSADERPTRRRRRRKKSR